MHRQVGVGIPYSGDIRETMSHANVLPLHHIVCGVMAQNARDVGSIPALGTILTIFITLTSHGHGDCTSVDYGHIYCTVY